MTPTAKELFLLFVAAHANHYHAPVGPGPKLWGDGSANPNTAETAFPELWRACKTLAASLAAVDAEEAP